MENNERDRKLDQWLDEALSDYSAAEPRFGLEQRVLNRVRAEERSRARKWDLWRWIPAFGAIAALIVIAVAVRPVMERKVTSQQTKPQVETYSSSQARAKAAADTSTTSEESPKTEKAAPAVRGNAVVPQESAISSRGGDRDRLSAEERVAPKARVESDKEGLQKGLARSYKASAADSLAIVAPPPPLPPPASQQDAQGTNKPAALAAQTVSTTAASNEQEVAGVAMQVQPAPILLDEKITGRSTGELIARDARRKEAHVKPEAKQDEANVMNFFGVNVRVQGGPSAATQQFPTPVPLSKQEKAALAAARELKDNAVTQHKSVDITPIEIKGVEIKPLEGPEK